MRKVLVPFQIKKGFSVNWKMSMEFNFSVVRFSGSAPGFIPPLPTTAVTSYEESRKIFQNLHFGVIFL